MWKDEVLEKIYKIREEHAKAFNYDLQNKQAESERLIISKPFKEHKQNCTELY